jgi:predicted ATPase/class 3 adenylate cyclase
MANNQLVARRSALPEGEVTFVFTDVEGSTRLLERFPADYGRLIARHHEALAGAVAEHGGVVFETIGDAVYSAFADPAAAVGAAADMQRALAEEDWRPMDPIRVRAGIHTGAVERKGRHYFGPALYRCARLMATAHGGQVVLSQATAELIRSRLSGDETLVDLGRHRLKDLREPERVLQLAAPGLDVDFPPLRSEGGRPNNLPADVDVFLGRESELARLCELLTADARIVTLTGPGGSGKTRLALRAAETLLYPFKDGVFFVDLAPLADPQLVVGGIAEVLRVPPTGGRALIDSVITHLAGLELLLVLDNFEHIAAAAGDVAAIVAAAPRLRVLVTSRVVLAIQGEHELVVPPLPLPAGDAHSGEILQSPAVQLFIVRARETRQGFDVGEDAPAIGDICRRLDGLPLAIELAAARTRVLPPSLLLERLKARLDLLTEGPVDLPARQRTLRDTIAWSYELLAEHEQAVLRGLGVFRGGCTLAAAEAVVAGATLDVLDSLARQSLLGVRWDELGEPRFELLETVAEFARERLTDDEAGAATRRHAAHYADYAQAVGPHLYDDGRMPWLRRLGADRDNFRVAIGWSLANVEPVVGMRIMSSLWLWWWTAFQEARVWAEQLLALTSDGEPTSATAGTAFVAEIAAAGEFDVPATRRHAETAIAISRQIGNDHLLALAQALGAGALAGFIRPGEIVGGDWTAGVATMRALCEGAIEAGRRSGEPWAEGWATMMSALMALLAGEPELARDWATDGVARLRALDDSWSAATASTTLAFALIQLGELEAAREALTGVVEELLAVGDLKIASNAQVAHGLIDRFTGELSGAAEHYAAGLELCARSGDPGNAPMCLEGVAAATAMDGPAQSVRLLGAARALYDAGNVPGLPGFEPMYEGTLEALRGIVGLEETDRLLTDGAADARHMPLLQLLDDPATTAPRSQR